MSHPPVCFFCLLVFSLVKGRRKKAGCGLKDGGLYKGVLTCNWNVEHKNKTEFLVTLKVVFKIKGACNASNYAISVVSVTNSNSVVLKTTIVKRFDFHHTKAMAHCQCAIFDEFLHWREIAS